MIDFNKEISYYANIRDKEPKRTTLTKMLERIRTGKYRAKVEDMRSETNPERKAELKNGLPCFTVSGYFTGSAASTMQSHSGFVCLDIDAKHNEHLRDFHRLKEYCSELPFVACCFHSCGGKGYALLIQIEDPQKHKSYFDTLCKAFAEAGIVVDKSGSDVSRKRYISYDGQMYLNMEATTFDYVLTDTEPQHIRTERTGQTPQSKEETRAAVEALLCTIESEGALLEMDYNVWFETLCGLANEFAEDGLGYALRISEHITGFKSADDVEKRYGQAIKKRDVLGYHINSFFHNVRTKLQEYRINSDFAHITQTNTIGKEK